MLTEEKWYEVLLRLVRCHGAEGEASGQEGQQKEEEEQGEEEEEEEEPKPKGNKEGEDLDGLTSALRKERAERKRLEKEAKQLRKFREDLESKDATEAQKAQKKAEQAEARAEKLAKAFRVQKIESTITKFATRQKFRDVDDALAQVVRDMDSWILSQDDDDPSEIEVDEKAVEKAVKELAEKKKYLLDAEGELEPSGSKFGGGKNKNDEMDEATLRSKYSGLRPPVSSST